MLHRRKWRSRLCAPRARLVDASAAPVLGAVALHSIACTTDSGGEHGSDIPTLPQLDGGRRLLPDGGILEPDGAVVAPDDDDDTDSGNNGPPCTSGRRGGRRGQRDDLDRLGEGEEQRLARTIHQWRRGEVEAVARRARRRVHRRDARSGRLAPSAEVHDDVGRGDDVRRRRRERLADLGGDRRDGARRVLGRERLEPGLHARRLRRHQLGCGDRSSSRRARPTRRRRATAP